MKWIQGSLFCLAALAGAALAAPRAQAAVASRAAETIEVDIEKLTKIDWQQGKELPKEIRDLDKKEIVISGYMHTQFNQPTDTILITADGCQCAGTPLPHHFVRVKLPRKVDYKPGQLTFIGTFSAGEELKDGFVESLYRLEGDFL